MCQLWSKENIYFRISVYARGELPTIERVHVLLSNVCGNNGLVYIDDKNIKVYCLYRDC